jgi:CobQ-like glutamine amidotransferase family enzyme
MSKKLSIKILHLYPREMNLYGDHGNVLALRKRLEWRGVDVEVVEYEPGEVMPEDVDIIFGGGGQDSGQIAIKNDLLKNADKLKKMVEDGVPTLAICGIYQLFGRFFRTGDGEVLEGIKIFDIETVGGKERLIGNTVLESDKFGEVVGYENHSGKTMLDEGLAEFGRVVKGAGNNGEDAKEGVFYKNCIGTYLHGPLLPKNPRLTDFLIKTAIKRKYGSEEVKRLKDLDDALEDLAHKSALSRPR